MWCPQRTGEFFDVENPHIWYQKCQCEYTEEKLCFTLTLGLRDLQS